MYGIIHGGMCLELRRRSIEYMTSLPFDGFAMGGALGKNRCEQLLEGHSSTAGEKCGVAGPCEVGMLVAGHARTYCRPALRMEGEKGPDYYHPNTSLRPHCRSLHLPFTGTSSSGC